MRFGAPSYDAFCGSASCEHRHLVAFARDVKRVPARLLGKLLGGVYRATPAAAVGVLEQLGADSGHAATACEACRSANSAEHAQVKVDKDQRQGEIRNAFALLGEVHKR